MCIRDRLYSLPYHSMPDDWQRKLLHGYPCLLYTSFPEEYQKSAFCMKKRTLHILLFFIGILMIGTSYVNLSDLTVPAAIACGIYLLVLFVYTQVRYPYVKAKQEKKEDK